MATSARKLAIVTGTTSGVGSAVAALLLDRGWDVIGVARRESTRTHAHYNHMQLDLADLAMLMRTFERDASRLLAGERWSRVALVNNAASVSLLGPIDSLDAVELARVHAVNVVAPTWCMGFVSRHTPKDAALRIVNVSSGAATHAFPGLGAYSIGKAGLRMAGMVLATEWESTAKHAPTRHNAAIMSYEPGAVDTPMQVTARTRPATDFPWVEMFIGMHDRGILVPAEAPAAEIVSFVESDDAPTFSERRLGE